MFRGGAGLGDPLERPYEAVMEDLTGDFLLERYAEPLYGVVPGNREATEALRARRREERGREAVPVREWMEGERRRLLEGDLIEPIKRMYAESLRLSERWAAEFRGFWDLPDDFDFDVATPEIDLTRQLEAQA
jgi:hypothetical protein